MRESSVLLLIGRRWCRWRRQRVRKMRRIRGRVFRGNLVREIGRMALHKDRGLLDRCSWPCGGYPVERGHGRGWLSWGYEEELES